MVDNFALIEEYMEKQALTWKEGEQFCKSRSIELKCTDIHKDNPTVLFCP